MLNKRIKESHQTRKQKIVFGKKVCRTFGSKKKKKTPNSHANSTKINLRTKQHNNRIQDTQTEIHFTKLNQSRSKVSALFILNKRIKASKVFDIVDEIEQENKSW